MWSNSPRREGNAVPLVPSRRLTVGAQVCCFEPPIPDAQASQTFIHVAVAFNSGSLFLCYSPILRDFHTLSQSIFPPTAPSRGGLRIWSRFWSRFRSRL